MTNAFSVNAPIIVLEGITTASGRDVQEGYMHLYAGAMQGIRNPKAHGNLEITRERAIHFLFLASLLMYKLDERRLPTPASPPPALPPRLSLPGAKTTE